MHRHAHHPHGGNHHHPRRSRPGEPGGFGPDFGLEVGPGFGRRRGRRRGGRGRGGDVRAAALLLLEEQPRHGYDLIQEIAQRSEEQWKPSPGSIYPVLQQLEDEGLIEFERVDGRKTARLTAGGETFVQDHRDELGTPWKRTGPRQSEETVAYLAAVRSLVVASHQVAREATPEQHTAATAVIDDARKALYGLLAQ